MKVIGITGNIGAGKTKIARIFEKFGCKVIELDRLGHRILESSTYKKKIINTFGKFVLDKNNKINREKLRKIVFSNPSLLKKLNAIVHPGLKRELKNEINKMKRMRNVKAIVVDAALVFEIELDNLFDVIITVYANKFLSFIRLMKSRNMNLFEFLNIYNSQMPVKEKKRRADFVITNNLPWVLNKRRVEKKILKIIQYLE